jgi:lipoprotein-anchoring transpeptidase ErfK/SrfK
MTAAAQSQPATVENPKAAAKIVHKAKKTTAEPASLSKAEILEAEQLLANLGYWVGPVDGVLDPASRQALIAFQKVEGRQRTGRLTAAELQALRSATRPAAMETGYAHVEADLSRQILFVIDANGTVTRTLSISSGSGQEFTSEGWTRRAVTPTGRFKVYRKVEGWRKAPLGMIYYPNYIMEGIAIHGSPSVPATPASHGCIRIPVFAAKEFSQMTPTGTVVIVHSGAALAQARAEAARAQ